MTEQQPIAEKDASVRCRHCGARLRRTSPAFYGVWVADNGNHDLCPSNGGGFNHEPIRVLSPGGGS